MTSSSDEDDGDYVPEADDEQEEDEDASNADAVSDAQTRVTAALHIDKLWDDMNADTAVSKKAADMTAKLLGGLTKKTRSSSTRLKRKKYAVREFSMPVLSVDVKKSRKDMAEGMLTQKMERVVKFAGKEYSVSTTALPAKGEKKGLDRMFDALNEPKQVSTIEKSSFDWNKYKEKEGIEEELTQYTKDGYIEKQEFLQRLDVRRFEIERAERDKQRKLQQQQDPRS
ncbi:unnamed protein product [Hyaloperonospora brassicae]|uniref:BCNT-C domain-containing protein n=1 Tax=Hyaloperonospora brassicae TaxID=162125 RepID=A0AAV0U1V9_HYABA|nr:unnamed protein product [Hyaloperonospora brassicae]